MSKKYSNIGGQFARNENKMWRATRLSNVVRRKGIKNVRKQKKG